MVITLFIVFSSEDRSFFWGLGFSCLSYPYFFGLVSSELCIRHSYSTDITTARLVIGTDSKSQSCFRKANMNTKTEHEYVVTESTLDVKFVRLIKFLLYKSVELERLELSAASFTKR